VTAGPCREPIDPVRYISNRSSGKMGYAIATAARDSGARTTLISGPVMLRYPQGVRCIGVESTQEMFLAVQGEFSRHDVLIMAAAPADFRPSRAAAQKIKKVQDKLDLTLEPTVDILKSLIGKKRGHQRIIGFALETENGVANARKKLKDKQLDLIVLNSPADEESGFDYDTNRMTILQSGRKPIAWPLMSKDEAARKLVEMVARML
jgi:phosphopantothenoylcysteine decarboxylase/phosphopantothenate--cysteine ligase